MQIKNYGENMTRINEHAEIGIIGGSGF